LGICYSSVFGQNQSLGIRRFERKRGKSGGWSLMLFDRWWKRVIYDYITGDSPDDGNGDSTKKRANAIRPYENIQSLHCKLMFNHPEFDTVKKCEV